jgi:hypothetical protein
MSDFEVRRDTLVGAMSAIERFSRGVLRRPLRRYQLAPARAIIESVTWRRGLTFAVMMSRQAGKNETSAHVEAYLLNYYRRRGGSIVKAAPTFRPQALNSLMRLQGLMEGSALDAPLREEGYMLRLGQARALFFSASREANVVGATARLLLEGDEAQDLDAEVWNRVFRPMAASTNATTVLWGTAWTRTTLLATTIRALRALEARDGWRRVFIVPWEHVAAEVPAYGVYVRGEMARLGREHPLIRTQYLLEELDGEAGMFPPATRRLMQGTHPRQRGPLPGAARADVAYALLVDVGGGAEEGGLRGAALRATDPRKDATALTVVQIVRGQGPLARYLVVDRAVWVGAPQDELLGALLRWAELWGAARIVVDATGLGAPLAQALERALGSRVRPFVFTASSKSAVGWGFLALCNAGRFGDHAADGSPEQTQFWREVAAADFEVLDGPGRLIRWGVADPAVHDDLLMSAALCALLEEDAAAPVAPAQIIEAADPLA